MPRPSNRKERRGQIIDAFRQVLAESGYEKATNHAVAARAGLAPGLIHYHFKNKQEILLELVKSLKHALEERYETLKKGSNDPFHHLSALVRATLMTGEGSNSNMVAAWVAIGNEALKQEEVGESYRKLTDFIYEEFLHHLNQIIQSQETARSLAAMTLATIEGAFQVAAANPKLIPEGSAAPTLLAMLQGVLREHSP